MSGRGWLPFGQRSKGPSSPRLARSPSSPPPPDHGDFRESEDSRRPGPSRTTSLLSLSSLSFSLDSTVPSPPLAEVDILVNDADKVWHNPSTLQIAESLQVFMMTRSCSEPIPAEYTAHVQHLLEAFRGMQTKVDEANCAREEELQRCNRLTQDFQAVMDEWSKCEKEFRAEIKTLEVMLAQSCDDGLEKVTLNRARSVVDRNKTNHQRPQQFVQRLEVIRKQKEALQSSASRGLDGVEENPTAFLDHSQLARTDTSKTVRYLGKDGRRATDDTFDEYCRLPSRRDILLQGQDVVTSQRLTTGDNEVDRRADDSNIQSNQYSSPHSQHGVEACALRRGPRSVTTSDSRRKSTQRFSFVPGDDEALPDANGQDAFDRPGQKTRVIGANGASNWQRKDVKGRRPMDQTT
ncbi:hypothetical protein E8E14_003379 [Neopestalotiopsis sp. 37M]|nr:hypothetical protein E8E14_003379 [Neopestalotiopsis sp. 37M]